MDPVLELVRDNWKEWLQVALIVAVVAYVVRSLQRTAARHAAWGVVGLLAVYATLKAIRFTILADLIERMLSMGVIILVVLFREEARALLGQLGRRLRRIYELAAPERKPRVAPKVIEEVATAADRLANEGYGALIVIEMHDSLDEIVETGHPIDSAINAFLIEAIFTSRSPIHDGALVVRGNRIAAAGAVLPLYRGDHPALRRAGTRHRAALGITMQTDAAVVVVSEDSGRISVAKQGALFGISEGHTRRELVSILANDDPTPTEESNRIIQTFAQIAIWGVGAMKTIRAKTPRWGRKASSEANVKS